jgi:hypothetical protein
VSAAELDESVTISRFGEGFGKSDDAGAPVKVHATPDTERSMPIGTPAALPVVKVTGKNNFEPRE